MPNAVDPNRPGADLNPHAARDPDKTSASFAHGGSDAPQFGPAVAGGEVGTLGPYRIVKQLGAGGMGAVYLALDTRLDRKLALKVMLPRFAADASARERFLREAKAAAKISHDNVVTVYEADERDGVPYIAMQFLQGCPLDEFLKAKGPPPLPHILRIAREAALGLAAAHELGLVHRDIKPANLWLEAPAGRVKVLDFGLAKPIGSDAELTRNGEVVGTPAFMSPEQARGEPVDARTDLFSLGTVLYGLCTGRPPFTGPNVLAVLMALGTEDPVPVRERNPNVPESFARLIHQLLAKKPEDRPQTAAEVAERLLAILEQLAAPPVAEPPVPMATAADLSTSQPVVVHPLPAQPPIVVPMVITAQPQSAFANLDVDDATQAQPAAAAPRPARKHPRGKGTLVAVGVAVLLAVVAGVVVIKITNKDGTVTEITVPDGSKVEVNGKTVTPTPKTPGPVKPGDALPPTHKNGIGMAFVKVPKGTAWLGGGGGKPGETKVEIREDFYLGKYEVTQAEWEAVAGANPSAFSRTGKDKDVVKDIADAELKRFPVEMVSWDDCRAFITKLNEREKEPGWVYRLPTADEWEYACRGGPVDRAESAFDFYVGKPTGLLSAKQANFFKILNRPCKVGSYEANLLGLHDMHGNVWEWCADPPNAADAATHRVARGGDWVCAPQGCRAANRFTLPLSDQKNFLGLRVARVPSAPVAYKNGTGMAFVKVPKGTAWLGGGGGKPGETRVEISQDFYLGKYEVTQGEWEAVMGQNPSAFTSGNPAVKDIPDADLRRFPVENVSWDDCQLFISRLNAKEKDSGWVYRLPTASEMEYASRDGPGDKPDSAFDFYVGKPTNTLLPDQANFNKGLNRTCEVGSYEPNSLGLYDIHGNVWEWCEDADKRAAGTPARVVRGGSWKNDSGACRAAFWSSDPPSARHNALGLRVARVPSEPAGK